MTKIVSGLTRRVSPTIPSAESEGGFNYNTLSCASPTTNSDSAKKTPHQPLILTRNAASFSPENTSQNKKLKNSLSNHDKSASPSIAVPTPTNISSQSQTSPLPPTQHKQLQSTKENTADNNSKSSKLTQPKREPLQIINPKTGEVVKVTSPPPKKIIPIINPKTGQQIQNESSFNTFNAKNIIKKPFPVLITRTQTKKKLPCVGQPLLSTTVEQTSQLQQQSLPPVSPLLNHQQQWLNNSSSFSSSLCDLVGASSASHLIPTCLGPSKSYFEIYRYNLDTLSFETDENEESEEEVDKYEWTGLPGYLMECLS